MLFDLFWTGFQQMLLGFCLIFGMHIKSLSGSNSFYRFMMHRLCLMMVRFGFRLIMVNLMLGMFWRVLGNLLGLFMFVFNGRFILTSLFIFSFRLYIILARFLVLRG
jgi:hypothetical protein